MEQLEKVCKGLECCVLRDPDDHLRCGECPYNPHAISNEPCANGLKFNAIALINAQQERIAELEASQKWISVKDRLPERQEPVLVYIPPYYDEEEDEEYIGHVAMAYYTHSAHGGYWAGTDGNVYGAIGIIHEPSHWMPLPEPPKEAEHADGA